MRKFIGDRKFYKTLMIIVMPIVLQQFITQFVGLLDNLMVGQVGTSEMTGVSLANQLLFVFNLGIFGSLSGASIFATQYFGAKNKERYQETFRFKWIITSIIFIVTSLIFILFSEQLLSIFINSQEGEDANPVLVLLHGKQYLWIMLVGNLAFVIKEIYASSLREMKETFIPMLSGIIAIFVNLVFNYILIFGKFGFPELGVEGAAIATVISRFVEMFVIITYVQIKKEKYNYFKGIYKGRVHLSFVKKVMPKTLMLLTNELFWSLGLTLILSCYGIRGLDFVASFNICNTISNVFITVGTSLGNATAIILGNKIGKDDLEGAKSDSYKILFFAVVVSFAFAGVMAATSKVLPNLYNTTDSIKQTATYLILIAAALLPIHAFNTCCYFTLRSGGRILITILFDCVYVFTVRLPLAFVLAKYTNLNIYLVYTFVTGIDVIKVFVGYILVDKGIWLKSLVQN